MNQDFLKAVVLFSSFRGTPFQSCQAALLMIGLRGETFTGAELPGELVGGSKHISGLAVGSLITMGLLEVVGRVKSPRENAHGRKVDLLQIPANKYSTVRTWLRSHGYELMPQEQSIPEQLSLLQA